jgi:hypothetical protein
MQVKIKPEYIRTEEPYGLPEDGIIEVEPTDNGYLYKMSDDPYSRIYINPEHIDYIIVDGIPEQNKDKWDR